MMLKTTIKMARPHVLFSTKSVVLRTPMIVFVEEKLLESPPPFDSCINTMPIIRKDASTMRITKNVYIKFYLLFLLFNISFFKKRI